LAQRKLNTKKIGLAKFAKKIDRIIIGGIDKIGIGNRY
jgi:hypothetical protein